MIDDTLLPFDLPSVHRKKLTLDFDPRRDEGDHTGHPRLEELLPTHVRKLFHRMDGWIEHRLRSFVVKKWRNTAWRRYPLPRLVQEFGLVRLIYLVPGINPSSTPQWRPHRKAACGKTARAV